MNLPEFFFHKFFENKHWPGMKINIWTFEKNNGHPFFLKKAQRLRGGEKVAARFPPRSLQLIIVAVVIPTSVTPPRRGSLCFDFGGRKKRWKTLPKCVSLGISFCFNVQHV